MTDRYFDLSQARQNLVLEFMDTVHEEDLDHCIMLLQEAEWNLEEAVVRFVSARDRPPAPPFADLEFKQAEPDRPKAEPPTFLDRKLERRTSDVIQIEQKLVLKKNFSSVQVEKEGQNMNLREIKVMQSNKRFILHLRRTYATKINFRFGTLTRCFKEAKKRERPMLVYLQPVSDQLWTSTINLCLCDKEVESQLNANFLCYGMYQNSLDTQIFEKYVPFYQWPCMALISCQEQPVVLKVLTLVLNRTGPKDVLSALGLGDSAPKQQLPLTPSESDIDSAQVEPADRLVRRETGAAQLIQRQKQEYQRTIEQLVRQQKQQERTHHLQSEKKLFRLKEIELAKAKLQAQTTLNPVHFVIRMTSGEKVEYNFSQTTKIGQLFELVRSSGKAVFQDEENGRFDLVQSFPRLELADKAELTVQEVFGQTAHQILYFKEL